jgi:splicing factor 3A subunit 3
MDSVIEVQRQTHEDLERFEKALTTLLAKPQPSHREKLRNGHNASQVLDRITARAVTLDSLYRNDERRQNEIHSISAPAQQNDLSEFYARLAKIEEHHRKYPDSGAGGFELELAGLLADPEEGEDGDYEQEDRAFTRSHSRLFKD